MVASLDPTSKQAFAIATHKMKWDADRQTDRQTDRQIDRQTDRQTNRQIWAKVI